ncbi:MULTISPECIES: phage tail length tape measure family protein [Comamonas]|uniref:phage tail length tape measure family protein n=1 Tax=Comamonas TaxID=283 RepID=UPI0001DA698A|nr:MULTISPECIES: phage tail length tape measure family protein [Comamonas]EFI62640.1 Prophage tail length tape measure [Comamonas thiooxydans]TFF55646.1 tail length tape measure protein [Comamonas sp. A23]
MSDTDRRKVQIEASLDATGVREGAVDAVAAAKGMAAGVEAAGQKAAQGLKPLETQPQQAAVAMSRAEKNMVGSIQRATVAMQSGGKAGSEYYEILAKQRGISGDVLKPYIDQLRQAEAAQKRLSQPGQYVMSDRAHSAAMRGVPAQFQDIIVSLQGGQNAMTVFLQQGSQLMSMFGGAGEAAKALGGYVLGMVNPFTLAAAAAGVLAYGLYSGAKEAHAFLVVLQKTGNQAGTSVQQLVDMSAAMDNVAGITQAKAAEALVTFAANAGVGAERLQRYTTTAIEWERATGQSVEEVAKDFKKLGEDPVKAVLELNKQMDFLTSATFEQIKSLQEVGRETDAARVAQDAYDSAIAGATSTITANLGLVEKGWIAIRNVGAEVIDMIKSLGRQEGMHAVVERLQKEVNDYQERGPTNSVTESTGSYAKGLKTRQKRLDKAREMLGLSESANTYVQGSREREQALINLSAEASKHYDKQTQKRLELAAAEKKYGEAVKTSAEAQKQYDLLVAGINKKYEEKEKKGGSTAPASRRLDLSEIQQQMRDELATIDQQQRAVELRRQAGLISEQDFYSRKRELIVQANGTEQKALQAQIDRLEQEKVKGKEALEVRKQLVDVRGRLSVKVMEGENKLAAVDQDASMAMERQKAALESLTKTHQRYIEQLDKEQERTIAGAWMGDKERGRAQGKWQIEDQYLAEQRRLEDRQMFTPGLSVEQRQQIERRLQELQVEKEREIQVYDQTYQQLDLLQERWQLGASVAWQNFADIAANTARQTADVWTTALNGVAENLANLVVNGKASLGDLLRTLAMMEARTAFSKGIVSLGGAVRSVLGFDDGGYTGDGGKLEPAGIVHKGEFVINAENTKRLGLSMLNRLNGKPQGYSDGGLVGGQAFGAGAGLVGSSAGTVIIDVDVNVQSSGQAQVSATAAGNSESSMAQLGKIVGNAVRERIAQEMRPGGLLWSQRNGRA